MIVSNGEHRLVEAQPGDRVVIKPGDLVLADTAEVLGLPDDVLGTLKGLSHLARKGLAIHRTSDLIQPGSNHPITLEITAAGQPVPLVIEDYIGTIVFNQLLSPSKDPYNGRYNQPRRPENLLLDAKGISTNGDDHKNGQRASNRWETG